MPVPSDASEVYTPSSIFFFYFFLIHSRALFAFSQSEVKFAELGEDYQNMLSEVFWTTKIASSQFDEKKRTRFAKRKFAQ